METSLVIDRGNSTLKAFIFRGDDCICADRFHDASKIAPGLERLISLYNPSKSIYSATGFGEKVDTELLYSLMHRGPLIFNHNTPIPITLSYKTPATLGLDRIAAAVAACQMLERHPEFNFILTADAGTALTLDITDNAKRFIGGDISVGLNLRFQALNNFTALLPLVAIEGDCPDFGFNTETAIRSGAIHGITAEIEGAFSRAGKTFGEGIILLTGGDADIIAPHIDSSLHVIARPTLVADGLNSILHYNENIQKAY